MEQHGGDPKYCQSNHYFVQDSSLLRRYAVSTDSRRRFEECSAFETSVVVFQSIRRNISEDFKSKQTKAMRVVTFSKWVGVIDDCLPGFYTVQCNVFVPTFRSNVLPLKRRSKYITRRTNLKDRHLLRTPKLGDLRLPPRSR
jgi:hypothetical protein